MKTKAIIIMIIATLAFALPCFAGYRSEDGSIIINGNEIAYIEDSKLLVTGNVVVKAYDKTSRAMMTVEAKQVTISLAPAQAGKAIDGIDRIKDAEFDGPVKFTHTQVNEKNVRATTVATADSAKVVGAEKAFKLIGNVKITHDNPASFEAPAVASGDRAVVNLKSKLGPGEYRFKLESSPGQSQIEISPKREAPQTK